METQLITITEYCVNYNIEPSFIISLEDQGIITLELVDTEKYISVAQLKEMERYIHLHYDLEINIEGIDAIRHLLDKVDHMQKEITELRSRLRLHAP
ncbi:chaperone modulator CbpM [Pedobacter frigoris]|uniref:chaperone modulator CbpM n=1 Tax=Pedobacter frigoris TaxID=2571272 RepID=UPI00292DB921|nr:chaperone modulator CbpM [Pedobacter frigoris]